MNRIIGVDFGTTNSVAVIRERNRLSYVRAREPLASLAINDPTRGVVYHNPDDPANPADLIRNSKLTLLADQEIVTTLEWQGDKPKLIHKTDPTWQVSDTIHGVEGWRRVRKNLSRDGRVKEGEVPLAEAGAISILMKLKDEINSNVGLGIPMDAEDMFIFAVPALTYHYRPLLHCIAQKAGWPVNAHNFRVFPEPYAVLLAMAEDHPQPGTYLVIDAGGGTTDWALVKVDLAQSGPSFELLGTHRHNFAGSDVDRKLANGLVGPASFDDLSPGDLWRIESEKIRLSKQGEGASGTIAFFGERHTLTWNDLVDATSEVFDWPISDGRDHFRHHDIDFVILAGGASQSPGFSEIAVKYFGSHVVLQDPNFLSHACCQGLTVAHGKGILSGLEQDVSFVEYPSQNRSTWLRSFEPLPPDLPTHDKRFVFQGESRRIPLFFFRMGIGLRADILPVRSRM